MLRATSAYLQTEGSIDYRDCQVAYYTYSMFDNPNRYHINVNVYMHSVNGTHEKSLVVNESFDNESDAINFGIETGKKFVDHSYESGKVTEIKTAVEKNKNNSLKEDTNKPLNNKLSNDSKK